MADPVSNAHWAWGFLELAKIVGGGLVAGAIALYFNGRRQDRDTLRAARALAARLVAIFERFALACAAVPAEHGRYRRDNPYDFGNIASLPELEAFPEDDAGWRALEPRFTIAIQTFDARIEHARGAVRFEADYGDADDIESQVERQAMLLGAAAWTLAADIRGHYNYPLAEPEWDIVRHFATARERFEQIDANQMEQGRLFREELEADEADSPAPGAASAG